MIAAVIGEQDRHRHARFIPAFTAAVLKTKALADEFADRAVVARWSWMRLKARRFDESAIRAVLLSDRDAHIIPRGVAARRFNRAHERAAHRIAAAACKQIGGEAIVRRVATGGLRVSWCSAEKREQHHEVKLSERRDDS